MRIRLRSYLPIVDCCGASHIEHNQQGRPRIVVSPSPGRTLESVEFTIRSLIVQNDLRMHGTLLFSPTANIEGETVVVERKPYPIQMVQALLPAVDFIVDGLTSNTTFESSIKSEQIESPASFFLLFEPICQSLTKEYFNDKNQAVNLLIASSKFLRGEKPEDSLDQVSRTISGGFRNPIQILYFCYFMDKSLKKNGYEIDFDNLYSDIERNVDNPEFFGPIDGGELVDSKGAFLSRAGYREIEEALAEPDQGGCPALRKDVFMKLKGLVYRVLDELHKNDGAYFQSLEGSKYSRRQFLNGELNVGDFMVPSKYTKARSVSD